MQDVSVASQNRQLTTSSTAAHYIDHHPRLASSKEVGPLARAGLQQTEWTIWDHDIGKKKPPGKTVAILDCHECRGRLQLIHRTCTFVRPSLKRERINMHVLSTRCDLDYYPREPRSTKKNYLWRRHDVNELHLPDVVNVDMQVYWMQLWWIRVHLGRRCNVDQIRDISRIRRSIAKTIATHLLLSFPSLHFVVCRLESLSWHANVFCLPPSQSSSGFLTNPLSPGFAISAMVCLDFDLLPSVIAFSWPHLHPSFAHFQTTSTASIREEFCHQICVSTFHTWSRLVWSFLLPTTT